MELTLPDLPADLVEYLAKLITPFHVNGRLLLIPEDPPEMEWAELEDASYHAAIVVGDPSSYMEHLWRVLKPGAHVLAVAPEEQPTGHSGAIALEDAGFEIRDAILWVNEPGRLHYVPKPSQRERHAGCEHLKPQKKLDTPDDDDGDEPEPHFDDRNLHKGNIHPTVKAKEIMKRLLADVPKGDGPVLDPFMGSGSTALACLETGHDFIGIELDPDYLEIADARVRHWDRARIGDGAVIESEHKPRDQEGEAVDFFDFLE